MTDSHREPRGADPDPSQVYDYPGYSDPAYASQAPFGPTYQPPAPTQRLPSYSPYGYDPYATGPYGAGYPPGGPPEQPPPEEPKSPRWLWVVAGIAVVTVIGLVIALVIVNSSRQHTVVAPVPPMQDPDFTTSTPATPPRIPTAPRLPAPTVPSVPTVPTVPSPPGRTTQGATQSVIYEVSGDGRAINITYVDTGGLLQTEFNVMLPWSKEVELSEPAEALASISIINVGREVNCSITVDGVVIQQRTGAGLTICTGSG
jgi:Mycobacterium membrane protein